ncbi:MAG TPA: hypothetical protein VEA16_16745 [Vicinamibacterales bacterium]|nr:hypothetical protein [Vicinamibacterales bacterium]
MMAARVLVLAIIAATPAWAQEHQHTTAAAPWQWSIDANVFAGYNYQRRKFTDFDEVESQNWLMTQLSRTFGSASTLELNGMFSFEAFTLRDIGSPQVFQTGETFEAAPLIDYQHPHDLVMNAGAVYRHRVGKVDVGIAAYAVGPAPIGPPVFMHRESAAENPQSPLSHHYLDSMHVTPGVVSISLGRNGFSIEAGAFHGREPDENRLDLDTAALDSFGARLSWADGPWQVQVSGADLKTPERTSPYDARRLTASAAYFKGDEQRAFAWTVAFGQNREFFGNLEAYLVEVSRRAGKNALYGRAESVSKDLLDAGFHPIGVGHSHRQSRVAALTLGYVRDVAIRSFGAFGVGGDITAYGVPANLEESYGSPLSFHLFLRYRGHAGARPSHRH